MAAFIIFCVVIFILYRVGKKKAPAQVQPKSQLSFNDLNPQQKNTISELKDALLTTLLKDVETKVITTNSTSTINYDNSIIDITGKSYDIPKDEATSSKLSVPYWPHLYVYSAADLEYANPEQKAFYKHFKQNFLNDNYYDLNGNLNYAFILLFDLLDDYEIHKDLSNLEQQIKQLGSLYPKTKSYGISFLTQKMEARGDNESILRLISEEGYQYRNSYNDDYWKLGSRYKSKLELNDEEVKWLNRVWQPETTFCAIEFCMTETVRLYLAILSKLQERYSVEGLTIDRQIATLVDVIARKQFRYRAGSDNYKYSIETLTSEIYLNIFKHAENAVRDYLGHKRKLNIDTYYTATEAKAEFEKLTAIINELIPQIISTINLPDEQTDIILYGQNTTRWKIRFEELTTNFRSDVNKFVKEIILLGELNKKNPSVENIFYEASKFIAKHDKTASLTLYIHYLHHDLKSATFDNKQLTKTIKKNLFKDEEQLKNFEIIINNLIKDRNLDLALAAVSDIYAAKRKRIKLDKSSINEVQKKHSNTVELLNEYLQDEDTTPTTHKEVQNTDSIQFEISNVGYDNQLRYSEGLNLSLVQTEVLDLFVKNNYTLQQGDLELHAKSKGLFKNQLVESINEACYETLDDVLIEEEEDIYTINENYYNKILLQ